MTARYILEVLDKGEIDGRTTHCADHRHGLRRHLLRDDDTEARGDLCQEADEEWSTLMDSALVYSEVANFNQPAGEHRTNGEIVGLHTRFVSRRPTQREYFETGQSGPRIGEFFPFLLRDGRDGAEHDRSRNRQLDRKRREPKRTADRPRGAGKPGMKLAAAGEATVSQTEQGNLECAL